MADAEIVVGADASAVERAMAVGKSAVKNFASEAESAIGQAVRSITSGLSEVVLAQGRVSFTTQQQQVRDFEQSSARMAVAVGRDLQGLRSEADAVGTAIGKQPREVTAWSSEVGKLTGSFSGAMAGMKGIAELAAATGRSANDYRGLAVELQTVGKVSGDTSQMVALLKRQADDLGVSGGVGRFADQVEALGDSFSKFAVNGPQEFGRLTEMAAKLGHGLNPQAASRVQQNVFGNITSNAFQWSRFLGRDIYDKNGNQEDPRKTIHDIVEKFEKTYKNPDQARRALILQFGDAQTGSQLHNLYQSGLLSQNYNPAPTAAGATPADALQKYLGTDAGKRDQAASQLAVSSEKLLNSSSLLGRAADALQSFAAGHPVASTAASVAAGGLISGGVNAVGKALTQRAVVGGVKTTAARMLAGGAAAGTAGLVGGALVAGAGGLYAGWELAGGMDEVHRQEAEEMARRDPAAEHHLVVSKEIRDRVRAARGFPTLPGGYVPSDEDTALAKGATTDQGRAAYVEKLKSEGISQVDADRIGKAMAEALGRNIQITVQSTPDNPLSATARTSQSSAAGPQGGT